MIDFSCKKLMIEVRHMNCPLALAATAVAAAIVGTITPRTVEAQAPEAAAVAPAAEAVHISLREAATAGDFVTLGDICDIVGGSPSLASLPVQMLDRTVRMEDVLRALRTAGVADHRILFNGPTQCAVFRRPTEEAAPAAAEMGEWDVFASIASSSGATEPAAFGAEADPDLADRLELSVADALGLPLEAVAVELASQPPFEVDQIEVHRLDDLGRVSWRVADVTGRSTVLHARATAALEQVVLKQPVRRGQVIRPNDLEKRELVVESLGGGSADMLDIIGQAAARDLDAGTAVHEGLLAPRLLVQRGQRIPVTVTRGGVRIIVFAVARDDGTYGQSVRAKNEKTGETMTVLVTGHQAGTLLD